MQRVPPKTELGKFQGFGLGLGPKGAAAAKAGAKPAAGAAGRRPVTNVAAAFRDSLEDDERRGSAPSAPSWAKPTMEAVQAQRQAEALMQEDPTVFQYDEVIDSIKESMDLESGGQVVRTDVMAQKKRVGLTVPVGAQAVQTGAKRQAKYIEKVLVATDRRKVEQQMVEDRLLKKEKKEHEGCEIFVTEAFKEELKRRKRFEEELEAQERRDQERAAEKQENGAGFADMYRNLLNGGLATSRGGEKIRERTAPRAELVKEEVKAEPADEAEEEALEAAKEEAAKREAKEEAADEGPSHGVQDVRAEAEQALATEQGPPPKPKKVVEAEEQAAREQKAMSARERFLARKTGGQAAA